MHEIVKINLDNEMDLIMAHKRSIKIAELCGLPTSAQTRFSTAVSEISRTSIAIGKNSVLTLGINNIKPNHKEIIAVITDSVDLKQYKPEAFEYASKISGNVEYNFSNNKSETKLSHIIASPGLISEIKIKGFKEYFKYEPPLSPYDEIRKKNIELISLTEKLTESENRYRQLTNTLPVLICVVDDRNRVLLTNNSLKTYLNLPFEIFDKVLIKKFIHADDAIQIATGWENAKKSGSSFFGQARLKKESEFVWHLISIIPNKTDQGSSNNWLLLFVDINAQKIVEETLKDNSELRLTQEKLNNFNTQLTFKNKQLEQFAFVASHDLQEPLRKIMIMVSRAGEHLTEQERSNFYFDRISASAARMSTLINDVLNYSRANDTEKLFTEVMLNQIVNESLVDLSHIIEEKSASITVSELPIVSGIEAQLRQLFYNLIINALKFSNKTPHIDIAYSKVSAADIDKNEFKLAGEYHAITVSDNGIGMDEVYSEKIFDMFQRLHHRDKYGGNGIGLALCRRIVENHTGKITLISKPNVGSIFKIYLPIN